MYIITLSEAAQQLRVSRGALLDAILNRKVSRPLKMHGWTTQDFGAVKAALEVGATVDRPNRESCLSNKEREPEELA